MERQGRSGDRARGLLAALVVMAPIVLAGCEERPAYVVDPDRAQPYYPEPATYRPTFERPQFTVTVREGDSLSKIALRCDTTSEEIARLNDLDLERPIYPGQVLRVPEPPREDVARDDSDREKIDEDTLPPPPPRPRPRYVPERHDDDVTPHHRPDAAPAQETADANPSINYVQSWWDWWMKPNDQPPAPDQGSAKFMWPVQGRVIEGFGRDRRGERNDGINIAAEEGTPIHAAAAGTVTYAGNELKGYGNLVLIKHADGYVTAYAHAGSIRVSRGDVVGQGQVIGTTGQTGDVDRPQLHFEIRRGVQAVDPERYLDRAS